MPRYVLDVVPIPKGRPRLTRSGIAYTPARTKEYEHKVKSSLQLMHTMPPYTMGVTIEISFHLPRLKKKSSWPTPMGDIDNYAKAVLDAANGVLFTDDRLIDNLSLRKIYADNPCIILNIKLTE